MSEKNVVSAIAYYQAVHNKDVSSVAHLFHDDVQLVGPMANLKGKQVFLESASKYAAACGKLIIREKFGTQNNVLIVYDVYFAAPIGIIRTASLLNFKDGLIVRIELFFDVSPFKK